MKLRILILGKTGQLGWELSRAAACLGEIKSYDYPQVDFRNYAQLKSIVYDHKPHIIFNAVAYTAVDRAESEPEVAEMVNATALGVLAESAQKMGAALVHYSTDYVFDGNKGEPYRESDLPHPINVYGQTKLNGENAVIATGRDYLILRTSWVYSMRRGSFVTKVLEWSRNNKTVKVVQDQSGSPTWARLLAEISVQAIVKGGEDPLGWIQERAGVYHLAGDGSASRFEWAKEILANDPHKEEQRVEVLIPAATDEFPSAAARPAYSALDCGKFKAAFGLSLPDWKEALALAMAD